MIRIVINGFGRIGKTFLRSIMSDPQAKKKIKVVAINIGPCKVALVAHGFKYDTLMGTYPGTVSMEGNKLIIDDQTIEVCAILDPQKLTCKQWEIDWVVECTGRFTKRNDAAKHLAAGAKKVLISAPATDEDVAIIPGVNMEKYDAHSHQIVSLGSCTTNALVPTVHVLHKTFGIKQGFMSTVHAYTNTQALLDVDVGDVRRSRAAALNMVPTTTGATEVIGKIIPELNGFIQGHSIRVPIGKVSLLDFGFIATKPISVQAIHEAFLKASQTAQKGVIDITYEQLVSSDFSGNPFSVVMDATLTQAVGPMGKVFGWYDNEWAYSERLKDFLMAVQ